MGYRRKARECALQMLFQIDMTGEGQESVREAYWKENPAPAPIRSYADRIVRGTVRDLGRIDSLLGEAAEHWRLDRMARVDRSVLRTAVYEFLHEPHTPKKVVINEAIEVAKRFGAAESPAFVNGVLDRAATELGRTG